MAKKTPLKPADQKLLDEIRAIEDEIRKAMIKTSDKFEKRYLKGTADAWKDMERQVIRTIMRLETGDGGIIPNSGKNLQRIRREKKGLKEITKRILKEGKKYFNKEGIEIQEISQAAFTEKMDFISRTTAEPISFEVLSPAALQTAANQSILIYGDSTGRFADEITNILIRKVIAGTTNEELVNYYKNIIPSIDKPKRGGGRFVLSAEERALMTVRTETNRLFNHTTDRLSKEAFGADYWVVNYNPMDRRTSSICRNATNAGVMKYTEMVQRFGLPPRHPRCRSSIGSLPDFVADGIGKGNRP